MKDTLLLCPLNSYFTPPPPGIWVVTWGEKGEGAERAWTKVGILKGRHQGKTKQNKPKTVRSLLIKEGNKTKTKFYNNICRVAFIISGD